MSKRASDLSAPSYSALCRRSRRTLLVWGLAALALCGCKNAQDKETEAKQPIAVQVMTVSPSTITRTLSYDADLKGELEVQVFGQVADRILSLPVEVGDQVKQGQLLAVLRSETLSDGVRSAVAAVEAARADQQNLKDELGRAEKLLQKNIVSRAQVDQLRARMLSAEAQVRRLEAMAAQASTVRGNASVRAPISGVVGRRFLSQGDMAAPGVPILTLVRLDRVELWVAVPEQDLASLQVDMPAQIRVARYERVFAGKVTLISPTIDRQTRTAQVKVEAKNSDHALMPGMLARVNLEVEQRREVAVVPYSALVIEAGAGGAVRYRAFVVQGGKAAERQVELGLVEGRRVQLTAGVRLGEQIVTKGQHLLEEGSPLKVTERITLDSDKPQQVTTKPQATTTRAAPETEAAGRGEQL